MSQPYIGQLLLVGFNFAPNGWIPCDGRLLPISEYDTLFNLIGTTYGGDGQTTFAVPNLNGRVALHMGTGASGTTYQLGEMSGVESVTLISQQMPLHNHPMNAAGVAANIQHPGGNLMGDGLPIYHVGAPTTAALLPAVLPPNGGSQPHTNMQPYLAMTWVISPYGVYPSQT